MLGRRGWPAIAVVTAVSVWAIAAGMAAQAVPAPAPTGVPAGFRRIFNGKNLDGWHWSRTDHHGTVASATVEDGAIVLRQHPYGQGGLLLTDKTYHDFEFYVEVKEAWGCNSGLFLRSTEGGSAYQVELDQTRGNGNLLGELMRVSLPAKATKLPSVWHTSGWNSFRVRMTGDAPHLTLWVNGVEMWDVQEPRNDKIAGETSGHIGLQLHWYSLYQPTTGGYYMVNMWKPGAAYAFRNLAVKVLK